MEAVEQVKVEDDVYRLKTYVHGEARGGAGGGCGDGGCGAKSGAGGGCVEVEVVGGGSGAGGGCEVDTHVQCICTRRSAGWSRRGLCRGGDCEWR